MRAVPAEAKQFAFLIGQFDLVVKPKAQGLGQTIHGVPKLVGTWKAWRALDGFGIEDDLRVTDESGNPKLYSHSVRYYDSEQKRWIASTIDVYRGVFNTSMAEWKDNAVVATSHGTDAEGKVYASRARYYDITPTGFKFRQDRSFDEGKTWDEGLLSIDAKRIAATAARP
ncbi:MAG: hypothetical protein JWM95_5316 [Gemmatimonadetes bacterium]|nr:hypothetical protein [Gemmatimonadota bacterium]